MLKCKDHVLISEISKQTYTLMSTETEMVEIYCMFNYKIISII